MKHIKYLSDSIRAVIITGCDTDFEVHLEEHKKLLGFMNVWQRITEILQIDLVSKDVLPDVKSRPMYYVPLRGHAYQYRDTDFNLNNLINELHLDILEKREREIKDKQRVAKHIEQL